MRNDLRRGSVAVVIVNYRTPHLALGAVRSLIGEREHLPGLRVVLVDGGSGDGSPEVLAAGLKEDGLRGWTKLLPLAVNGGFGWANNQAIQTLMQGDDPPDYLHLLNPDAEVQPGAVAALASVLDREPDCAASGSLLLNPDGTSSGSAFFFQSPLTELFRGSRMATLAKALRIRDGVITADRTVDADWVTGASVMFRAEALRGTGLFDTGFFLYFEEEELMWRLHRAGWRIRHEPASRVRHVGGAATGVHDGGPQARTTPPRPAYWYASRRRFFSLSYGRFRGSLASVAWLAGTAAFRTRRAFGAGQQHRLTDREVRDLWRHGLLPTTTDAAPAIARWSDPTGQLPTWMRRLPRTGVNSPS